MSARHTLSLLLLLIAASLQAGEKWSKAPDGFRGVKFGATKEEAEVVLGRMRCNPVQMGQVMLKKNPDRLDLLPSHTVCSTTDESKAFRAGERIIGTDYVFDQNRFVGVRFRQPVAIRKMLTWAEVVPVFKAEYGEAGDQSTSRMKDVYMPRSQSKNPTAVPTTTLYEQTCLEWKDAKAELTPCSRDQSFGWGALDSAAWLEKKRAWRESMRANAIKK